MRSIMRSLLVTAAAAGVSYLWRNRASLSSMRSRRMSPVPSTPDRGTTIYHNHPVAE